MFNVASRTAIQQAGNRLRALLGVLLYMSVISASVAAPPVKLSGAMVSGGDVSSSAINSTSTRVVFIADRETDNSRELYSAPIGGGVPTKLSGTMVTGGNVIDFGISPNGQSVAFLADRVVDGRFELWLAPIDGSAAPVSLSGPVAGNNIPSYQWVPNSGRVVFAADKTTAGTTELYSVATSGGLVVKISGASPVPGGNVFSAFKISASGARVVFRADIDAVGLIELYSAPITPASAATKLSGMLVPGGVVFDGFLISPDSARVVFRADKDADEVIELYSAPIATADSTTKLSGTLVPGGDVNSGFQISPDSTRVVFHADKDVDNVPELYSALIAAANSTMKLSGMQLPGGAVVAGFQISADSARVVFRAIQDTAGVLDVYSAPIATPNATTKLSGMLVPSGAVAAGFQISPDSARVVFTADKDTNGVSELYSAPIASADSTIKLSGTLVLGGAVSSNFQISPDSARVVFLADKDTDNANELYSAPIATANAVTKLSGALVADGDVSSFQISPDSMRVVFIADKDTDSVTELYSTGTRGGGAILDIDGDGVVLSTTDLLMLTRWQLGIRGTALFGGITFAGTATRTTVTAIEDHLRRLTETGLGW